MDLKHFKKTAEAPDHTMLSHPDGHQIKVLHAKLDKSELRKLKSLPIHQYNGGLEEPDTSTVPQKARDMFKEEDKQDANEKERYGSKLHEDVPEGTEKLKAGQRMRFADGGNVPEEEQAMDEGPSAPPVPQQAPQQAQVSPMADYSQQLNQGLSNQQAGIQQAANAQGALGQAQAQRLGTQAGSEGMASATFDSQVKDINDERMAALNDYKQGHIDPNAYFGEKDAKHPFNEGHSKVMTAIGLILGGLGSGLTRGPNVALDFLNKNIDRNIAAQMSEMNKQSNVMTALSQQFGNVKDAAMMHGVMQRDILSDRLQEEAAKSQNPLAQAQAKQAIGALQAQNAPALAQLAYRQTVIRGMQAGALPPEAGVQALVEPAHQQKVYDALGKVRTLNDMQQNMGAQAQKLQQMVLNGVMSPRDADAMRQQYAPVIARMSAGRFNLEEATQQVKNFFPMPGDAPNTAKHKDVLRNQFFDTMRKEHEPVLVGNHIPVPKPAAQATSRSYRAGSNK